MSDCLSAPAALRNRAAILTVLEELMPDAGEVLEIGSGTGEHAVYFAAAFPRQTWLTSDLAENHTAINAWIARSGQHNVRSPELLDVRDSTGWRRAVDMVYTANTLHIMHSDAVRDLFGLAGRTVRPGGQLLVYGPFRVDGDFTSDSNRLFDASLRARDSAMGIRDLEWIDSCASEAGLTRSDWYAMPANNFLVAWRKSAQ